MSVETPDSHFGHLYPEFAAAVKAILRQATVETMGKHGVNVWVLFEGFRSQARQNWLYAQGRTRAGAIVTRIRISNHTSGLAADCYPTDIHGNIMWEAHKEIWAQFGHCVRANGMQWGGDFPKIHPGSTFVDNPHVETPDHVHAEWIAPAHSYLREHGLV